MPLITPVFPVIILLLGAAVLGVMTRVASVKASNVLALVVAACCFVSCVLLYRNQPAVWASDFWSPALLFGVELGYRADSLSLGLVLVTASVALIAVACCNPFVGQDEEHSHPYGALFLVLAGALSVVLSADLVTLCLSWGLLDLGMLSLTALAHGGQEASRTGLRLLVVNLLAGAALLAALLVVQRQGETFSLQATPLPTRVVSLMVIAGLLRLGLYPAFVALPSSVAMRLPSLILWHTIPVVVGGYVVARALSLTAVASLPVRELTLILGSLSIFLSPFPLWFERRLRSMATFIILNQVGHVALAAAIAAPYSAAIIATMTVGLVLALTLLFLSQATAHDALVRTHDVWRRGYVLVAFASLAGAPLTIGFVSRQLLYRSLLESNLAPLVLLSLLANCFLVAPLLKMGLRQGAEEASQGQIHPVLLGSMTVLAILLVIFGLYPPLLGLLMGAESALAAWPNLPDLIYAPGVPLSAVPLVATLLSLAIGYVMYSKGELIVARAGVSLETVQIVARMDWLFRALYWAGHWAASMLELSGRFFEGARSPGWMLVFATLVALLLLSS
jgi:formate hydrogenlyase subunit 3/multisubunit Na+/H+ antiporter MnhD subunit